MDILQPLARHVFVPAYQRRHGVYNQKLRDQITQSQFDSPERIREKQLADLGRLLNHAYENNRFYRKRFEDHGTGPKHYRSFEDFAKFPILTKDDIRENGESLISNGCSPDRLHWRRTGGSTGVPLQLYWDDFTNMFKSVIVSRHNAWAGMYLGDRRAALWGDTSGKLTFKEWLHSKLASRTIYLDTLVMNDETILAFCNRIRRFKPRTLMGHAHSIFFFADFLRSNNISDIRFEGIVSTAETLFPEERRVIEDVFGKVLFDRYGCEELSLIASECEAHDGLHIAAEMLYVEVLDGDENTPGRLVITDLTNYAMPFIRYEVGDLATTKSGPCSCGRGLPRLGKVVGRSTDFLYTPDGRSISGVSILDTFTIHIPGFKQVQVIQEELDELTFKIVKGNDFSQASLDLLAEKVPRFFGTGMKYQVEFVDRIPMTRRGKFQFSICKIDKSGRRIDESPHSG